MNAGEVLQEFGKRVQECKGEEPKEWNELTKEEYFNLCYEFRDNCFSLAVAVEKLLREKNT